MLDLRPRTRYAIRRWAAPEPDCDISESKRVRGEGVSRQSQPDRRVERLRRTRRAVRENPSNARNVHGVAVDALHHARNGVVDRPIRGPCALLDDVSLEQTAKP